MKKLASPPKALKPHAGANKSLKPKARNLTIDDPNRALLSDVRGLIEQARQRVSQAVNTGLVALYWNIGSRIRADVLGNQRADYGEKIVATLSRQLEDEYGSGFNRASLFRMIQFAELFQDFQIVLTLSERLGWSHFRVILPLKTAIQRDFYVEICRVERWSVRTLQKKISSMLFERTAVAKKPEALIKKEISELREEDRLSPDLVFRDPYVLDFLRLYDSYGEKDIEAGILREMASFLMELVTGFSFVARQKRIQIGKEDFYLDLLFYHRKLRRLIAIELKYGAFEAAHKVLSDSPILQSPRVSKVKLVARGKS